MQITLQSLAIIVALQDEVGDGKVVVLMDSSVEDIALAVGVVDSIAEGLAEDDAGVDVGSSPSSAGVGIKSLPTVIVGKFLTLGKGGGIGGG